MKRNHLFRLLGTLAVASSLLGTKVYADCVGQTDNGTVVVTKCSEVNGCGDDTKRIAQQHGTCPTYCCPGQTTTYYASSCTFTDFTIAGTPQCCADGSHHGDATVLKSQSCVASASTE